VGQQGSVGEMTAPASAGRVATMPRPQPPSASRPTPGAPRQRERRRSAGGLLLVFALLVMVNVAGLPYYMASTAERVRSPLHVWLKPTGYVGQAAGFVAFALFSYLWLYPLRKKFRWLEFTGPVPRWLDLHVLAGLFIPLLAAIHAAWRFTGLIGLGYGAMMVAWLSGIAGRYLYARIPRSLNGLEMNIEEVEKERAVLVGYIAHSTGIAPETVDRLLTVDARPYTGLGPVRTLLRMVKDDIERGRVARKFRRDILGAVRGRGGVDRKVLRVVLRLARRQMALSQQVRLLDATQQVFRYWHVAHRPFAFTALVAVALHVATAVALGVTWIR